MRPRSQPADPANDLFVQRTQDSELGCLDDDVEPVTVGLGADLDPHLVERGKRSLGHGVGQRQSPNEVPEIQR